MQLKFGYSSPPSPQSSLENAVLIVSLLFNGWFLSALMAFSVGIKVHLQQDQWLTLPLQPHWPLHPTIHSHTGLFSP